MALELNGTTGVSAVQTGAVESGDLPAEAYQKNNILGTVSESGGVPTGAIIERGSNSNGEFVRYADGTQICTRTEYFENLSIPELGTTPFGTLDYPASFVNNTDSTVATGSALLASGVGTRQGLVGFNGGSSKASGPEAWNHPRVMNIDPSTATEANLRLMAVGRWY